MRHPLLDCETIDLPPFQYLREVGTVFAEFGHQSNDSGNVSYGVQIGDERFFVKTAGDLEDIQPSLSHAARVALLRNAVRLHDAFQHPVLSALKHVIESAHGPLLIYPWLDGELLGVPREQRDDPQSSFQRFRSLPTDQVLACLDLLYDLHTELARAGWVAVDFYDGSLLYDFASARLWTVDLDMYRNGPFTHEMGVVFGSSRFMAPEEFETGARIDEQTTVFVMGRTALIFLSDGTLNPGAFRGSPALFGVVIKACAPERERRFASMTDFFLAWQQERLILGKAS